MPRKQNGFGSSQSLAFKGSGRVDRGKGPGAPGLYPSNRRYGSSVHRTVLEKWNLDSNWSKWRKGYEMYNWTAWSDLKIENPLYDPGIPESDTNPAYVIADLQSLLYQGTAYELPTVFTGIEFPTMKADVNSHYVAKRVPQENSLGFITEVKNNILVDAEQKKYREIWCKGIPDATNARLLLQMVGERLSDGKDEGGLDPTAPDFSYATPMRTEATVKNVLTADDKPAIYKGITAPKSINDSVPQELQPTRVRIRVPVSSIILPAGPIPERGNQGLTKMKTTPRNLTVLEDPSILNNKIIYIPNFFIEKPIDQLQATIWGDSEEFGGVTIQDTVSGVEMYALDPGSTLLPPSMYDLTTLDSVFTSSNATYTISGTYVFDKKEYQRFFGKQYLTDEIIQEQVQDISYSVLPFPVKGASIEDGFLIIDSFDFQSEIKMYPPLTVGGTIVFTDFSFTKAYDAPDGSGRRMFDTNVDPWMDEVFTSGEFIRPAKVYTCSCPSHSSSILTMPQTTQGEGLRKNNRQMRYPLPSVLGQARFEGAGTTQAAGKMASWQSPDERLGFRMCKHSVAAMFIDGLTVLEPSQYPTVDERVKFEEKLEATLQETMEAFPLSYKRQGLSLTEIVFALAQGLNLDDVETAYVVLNSDA